MQQKLCPTDGTPLVEMMKNGVTIDVCPECKGVWLDRGELEKLINVAVEMEREYGDAPMRPQQPPAYDRAAAPAGYDQAPRAPQAPYTEPYRDPRGGYGYNEYERGTRSLKDSDEWYEGGDRRYPKKKKSTLGRIFDIFD
jgi:Zn-finger nucleic acid-binding protein